MKKQTRAERKRNSALRHEHQRSIRKTAFLLFLAAAVLAVAGFWSFSPKRTDAQPPTLSSAGAQTGFQQLKGRWLRADGEYVIDIKGVDDSGRLDALYFNPRSIHVARAEASRQGAAVKVAIELRDEGYPGSTYDLTYDTSSGELRGNYYHAGLKQNFDVVFVKAS